MKISFALKFFHGCEKYRLNIGRICRKQKPRRQGFTRKGLYVTYFSAPIRFKSYIHVRFTSTFLELEYGCDVCPAQSSPNPAAEAHRNFFREFVFMKLPNYSFFLNQILAIYLKGIFYNKNVKNSLLLGQFFLSREQRLHILDSLCFVCFIEITFLCSHQSILITKLQCQNGALQVTARKFLC